MTKSKIHTIDVHVSGRYRSFDDFMVSNRSLIYEGVIESFRQLAESKKRSIRFIVNASLTLDYDEMMEWETEFILLKKDPAILVDHIIHHFEEIEEYEKCKEILNLYNRLTISKK